MNIDIDRAAIARYGLNIADVQDVVAIAVGGREAGRAYLQRDTVRPHRRHRRALVALDAARRRSGSSLCRGWPS